MMGPSRFLALLFLASLLFLSFTHGSGRVLTDTVSHQHSTATSETTEEIPRRSRVMIQVMDYGDPEANINPKYGDLFSPPPPSKWPDAACAWFSCHWCAIAANGSGFNCVRKVDQLVGDSFMKLLDTHCVRCQFFLNSKSAIFFKC